MALNLDAFAPIAEGYMFDEVRITRRVPEAEGTLNQSTGVIEYSTSETLIYEGKAWVAAIGSPNATMLGREDEARVEYEVGIPKGGEEVIQPMDLLEVVDSKFDPLLIGKVLTVRGPISTTFNVYRRMTAYLDTSRSTRD